MRFQCPFCQGVVAVANTDLGTECQCGHCGEIVTVPSYRLATGAVIADFIILEELGRGGMGIVYLAHQITLDRPAALKILSEAFADNSEFVVDFIKEARAAAKLNHPHIVQAYAVGEDEGVFFFAMEHIDGETMKTYLKREGAVPVDFALEIIQQIAEALDYAWKEQRLIHRDIKPDNIMLTRNGRAKLADLGLARVAGEIDDSDSDEVMGTPQYISPEHLTGAEMDVRSDIYSLGATLFHLITGRFAFEGRTATDIARKHLEEPLSSPRLLNPDIPEGVCDIIFKMMAKNPDDRYQSAENLVEDIRLVRKGKRAAAPGGRPGKQFTVKKGGGKTLMMKSPGATGAFTAVSPASTENHMTKSSRTATSSSSSNNIDMNTEQLKMRREKKAKTQLVIMISVCFAVLLGGIGFILWKNMSPAPEPSPKPAEPTPQPPTAVEPDSTPFMQAAARVLAFAKGNPDRSSDILMQCDNFFSNHPEPRYACDRKALAEILGVFVKLDEERRIDPARQTLHRREMSIIRENEEKALMLKANEESAKRAEERKLLEQQMAEDRKQREQERLESYAKSLEDNKATLLYRALHFSMGRNFKDAAEAFNAAIRETELDLPEVQKPKAQEYSDWAKKMQQIFISAEKIREALFNAGDKLNGEQVEIRRGVLGTVTGIRNGDITVRSLVGGQLVTEPVESLQTVQLRRIFDAARKLVDEPLGTFFYMTSVGEFQTAKDICPPDWTNTLEHITISYFKNRIPIVQQMTDENTKRAENANLRPYSNMPEFKEALKQLREEGDF